MRPFPRRAEKSFGWLASVDGNAHVGSADVVSLEEERLAHGLVMTWIRAGLVVLVGAGYVVPASSQLTLHEGITAEVAHTADFATNVSGGVKRGSSYLDNVDLTLTFDLGTAWGWAGAKALFYVLGNNGSSPSELVGDVQTVSNLDAPDTWKLYEGWVEQELASGRLSLKAGLYDLNSEFDVIDTGGLFLNSSHGIGPDFSQTGENGPSIFPTTSLALRLRASISESVDFKLAALDGIPGDVQDPGGTHVGWTSDEGLLIAGELAYYTSPGGGDVGEGGTVVLGAFAYTERTEHLGAMPGGTASSRNHGIYVFADHPLYAAGNGPGLSGFVRAGVADTDVNQIGTYLGAGFVYAGLLPGREPDRIGLAVAHARNGAGFLDYRSSQGHQQDGAETAIELTYSAQLMDWLSLQPDVQYIINPGTDPALGNALMLSLRSTISF